MIKRVTSANSCTLELLVNSFPFSKLIKPFWAAYAGFTKIIEKTIENTKITANNDNCFFILMMDPLLFSFHSSPRLLALVETDFLFLLIAQIEHRYY